MFVERRINSSTGAIELWWCDWEKGAMAGAKKIYLNKIADEAYAVGVQVDSVSEESAICWAYGRTLGNIAVFSPMLLGTFPDKAGNDAILPCDFVTAGKYRHGAPRWWCRTHQTHWGTKADEEAYARFGEMRCANHDQTLSYVVGPPVINLNDAEEVGIWCSLPAAISTSEIPNRPPRIHVHVRPRAGGPKTVDRDFQAVSLRYSGSDGLFGADEITRVNITPPAAFEFVTALERGAVMDCIKGVSAHQVHRTLGVTYKTAWFTMHRIRKAAEPTGPMLKMGSGGGVVEADETYIGKKDDAPTPRKKAGAAQKNMVFRLVDRGGKARSFHISGPMFDGIKWAMQQGISLEAHLQTDEARMYNNIGKSFASHGRVNHSIKEYVRGTDYTNTVESFFSVFKRGMRGIYQHCKSHHLHHYLAEFDFRFNNRVALGINDAEPASILLQRIEGKRLTYRRPHDDQAATAVA